MQNIMTLTPSLNLTEEYRDFILGYLADNQRYYTALEGLFNASDRNIEELIRTQQNYSLGKQLPMGWFPVTTIWLLSDRKIVGEAVLRHSLNESLKSFAGHVTYYVLPEFRGHGFGSYLLEAVKDKASKVGLEELLLCCDQQNSSSIRTIEKSGGILLDTLDNRKEWREITSRFRVPLSKHF